MEKYSKNSSGFNDYCIGLDCDSYLLFFFSFFWADFEMAEVQAQAAASAAKHGKLNGVKTVDVQPKPIGTTSFAAAAAASVLGALTGQQHQRNGSLKLTSTGLALDALLCRPPGNGTGTAASESNEAINRSANKDCGPVVGIGGDGVRCRHCHSVIVPNLNSDAARRHSSTGNMAQDSMLVCNGSSIIDSGHRPTTPTMTPNTATCLERTMSLVSQNNSGSNNNINNSLASNNNNTVNINTNGNSGSLARLL